MNDYECEKKGISLKNEERMNIVHKERWWNRAEMRRKSIEYSRQHDYNSFWRKKEWELLSYWD